MGIYSSLRRTAEVFVIVSLGILYVLGLTLVTANYWLRHGLSRVRESPAPSRGPQTDNQQTQQW